MKRFRLMTLDRRLHLFFMILWLLVLLVRSVPSIRVGTILNVAYQSNDSTLVALNGTCDQCLCQAFVFNTSLSSIAFNCYATANKCDLFHNFSTLYRLVANATSQFFFYPDLPPPIPHTTGQFSFCGWNVNLALFDFRQSVHSLVTTIDEHLSDHM